MGEEKAPIKIREIEFNGDWYILDIDLRTITENIFMRWDTEKAEAPKIILSTENWTTKLAKAPWTCKTSICSFSISFFIFFSFNGIICMICIYVIF